MLIMVNIINIIGIFYLSLTSTNNEVHLQTVATRNMIIVENSTGVLRSCTGSHCFGRIAISKDKVNIIYFTFLYFIYDIRFESTGEEEQLVVTNWINDNNYCLNTRTNMKQFRCENMANEIFYSSPAHVTNVIVRGFATYFENYIGCYYMNFHGINKILTGNVEDCVNRCNSRMWIGLSGKTSSGVLCSCFLSLDFGASSVSEEYCDCRHGAFNFDILCGGSEGYVSVYSTTVEPMWKERNITDLCIYSLAHRERECSNCRPGKKGDRCHLINCNIREGCTGQLNVFTISTSVCGCRCEDGHYMTQNFNCLEADECLMEPCGEGVSRCINTPGSYDCECLEGYILDIICEDIDECIEMEEECRLRNRTCQNTPGSYICSCEIGYMFIDGSCKDIDECLNPVCGRLSAACINTIGSYTCYCSAGFTEGVGGACFDIDECTNISLCNTNNSFCRNILGNFECNCLPGFLKIRPETPKGQCEDQDECNNTIDTCGSGVYCANIPGSFLCYCPSGMKLSSYQYSKECQDIDECLNFATCNARRSYCLNLPASYACVCHPGFSNVDSLNCERDNSSNTTIDDYDTTSNPNVELNGVSEFIYIILYTILGIIALIILKYVFTLRVKSRQEAEAMAAEITSSKLSSLS